MSPDAAARTGYAWPRRWAGAALGVALALAIASIAWAAFPALTGRVVDDAHVLSPVAQADLERKLADLETKSSIQLVVATVKSLDGQEIEPYANALFRFWKLGEAKKDNGLLLLVAPKEHRVRIEVGAGLEGIMTDAVSSIIIANAIAPRFKAGDFDGGVTRGVDDIVTALTSDTTDWTPKKVVGERRRSGGSALPLLIWLAIVLIMIFSRRSRGLAGAMLATSLVRSSRGGGFSGGGFSGSGGFSGGGGTSLGGGASGSW